MNVNLEAQGIENLEFQETEIAQLEIWRSQS